MFTLFFLCSLTLIQYCSGVVLDVVCIFSFLSATFILGLDSLFVLKLATSLPLHVLTGPGLPSPTDAAQPTTAQCILPAAPRD